MFGEKRKMSSSNLIDVNNELTVEADGSTACQPEQVQDEGTPTDESWVAVKPIESDSKQEIVNIVSLSVDYKKVCLHSRYT